MDPKPIWQSKAFWLNLITLIVSVLTTISGAQIVQDHPQIAAAIVGILGFLNLVLRVFFTGTPVTFTAKARTD